MISDLIDFGKWLDENNQDDFGKLLKDEDKVITINVQFEDRKLEFDNFEEIIRDSINNYDSIGTYHDYKNSNSKDFSLFANQLFFETNQNVMIPSNNAFACLTPFVVSLKRITKKKIEDSRKRNKGDNKNKGKKKKEKLEFTKFVSEINNYKKELLYYYNEYDNLNKINANVTIFQDLFEDTKTLEEIINEYYNFLYNNYDTIEELKKKISKKDPDIYLYFDLPKEYVLFNDMVYFYCKYLKQRAESIDESKINIENPANCQFCGSNTISFVKFSSIGIGFGNYNWNFNGDLPSSRLKICKDCSAFLYLAIQKLIHVFENHFILIPKLKSDDFNLYEMITIELNSYYSTIRSKKSKFVLLNKFMSKSEYNNYFNFDFVIFDKTRMGEDIDNIKKYLENYKAYLSDFEKNNLLLYNNGLNYLFHEPFKHGKKEKNEIKNIFDLEYIFKQFFVDVEDGKLKNPNLSHFYEIYVETIRPDRKKRKRGLFSKGFDNEIVSVFVKYMYNLFNLIYELNEDALNKDMLNEIVFNSLIKLQKHNKINKENPKGLFSYAIIKRLNYYFMLKKELLGDEMLKEGSVGKLKQIGLKYNRDSELEKIDLDDSNSILETIENDPALKYYIIGQFLGLIDGSKRKKNKKAEVFSNFVTNANRNNIRNLFVTEVLQKNNYYIEKMNKKGKFIFKLFEKDINSLFNESDGFSFEDYLLLIFTGYYTENVLSSSYGVKKKEVMKNE